MQMRPGRKGEWEVRRDWRLRCKPVLGKQTHNGHPMGAMAKNGADGAPGGDASGNRSAKEKGGEEIRCGKMGRPAAGIQAFVSGELVGGVRPAEQWGNRGGGE